MPPSPPLVLPPPSLPLSVDVIIAICCCSQTTFSFFACPSPVDNKFVFIFVTRFARIRRTAASAVTPTSIRFFGLTGLVLVELSRADGVWHLCFCDEALFRWLSCISIKFWIYYCEKFLRSCHWQPTRGALSAIHMNIYSPSRRT